MQQHHSRREFISLMAAGIASVASGQSLSAEPFFEGKDPDLVVFNAKIYTMDSPPSSSAFAVNAGQSYTNQLNDPDPRLVANPPASFCAWPCTVSYERVVGPMTSAAFLG